MAVIGPIVDCLMDKCYRVAIGRIGTLDTIQLEMFFNMFILSDLLRHVYTAFCFIE